MSKKEKKSIHDHSISGLWAKRFWKIQGLRFLIWIFWLFVGTAILLIFLNLFFTDSIEMSVSAIKVQWFSLLFMIIWIILALIATIKSNEYIYINPWNISSKKAMVIVWILLIFLTVWINALENNYYDCKIENQVERDMCILRTENKYGPNANIDYCLSSWYREICIKPLRLD